MHFVDEHRIRHLATDLAGHADQLRATTAGLRSASLESAWQSPAAGAFYRALAGLLGQADRLERQLGEAATALTAHGARAAARSAALANGVDRAAALERDAGRAVAAGLDRFGLR